MDERAIAKHILESRTCNECVFNFDNMCSIALSVKELPKEGYCENWNSLNKGAIGKITWTTVDDVMLNPNLATTARKELINIVKNNLNDNNELEIKINK